jgi:hypothetical protein
MRGVSIIVPVDIVETLTTDTLEGNVYLIDNNKSLGSTGEGTAQLHTHLEVGDRVGWFVMGLEVETAVNIIEIQGPAVKICNPEPQAGDFNTLWIGTVTQCESGTYPYTLVLNVEGKTMTLPAGPALVVG